MSVWVLAREVGRDHDGPLYEYFAGKSRGRVTPWAADADHFHDAKAAQECALTHRLIMDHPDEWRAIRLRDKTNPGRRR